MVANGRSALDERLRSPVPRPPSRRRNGGNTLDVFVGGVGPRAATLRHDVGTRVSAAGLEHRDAGLDSSLFTVWTDGRGETVHIDTPEVELLFDGYLHRYGTATLRDHLLVMARRIIDHGTVLADQESGLFNLVVHDKRSNTLSLANDPSGLLPLYLGRLGDGLFFGSHQYLTAKALGAAPDFLGVIFLVMQNFALGSQTYFDGVERLCAGELVTFHVPSGRLDRRYPETYFDHYAEPGPAIVDELWESLLATARPVVDDGRSVGIMLSEGFDSRLIAGAFHHLGADLHTFTHGTEGTIGTEITRTIARRLGSSHVFDPLDAGYPADLGGLRSQLALADNLHIPFWVNGAHHLRVAGADVVTTGYALDTTLGAHAFASAGGSDRSRALGRYRDIIRQDLRRVSDEDIESIATDVLASTRAVDLEAIARRVRRFLADDLAEQVLTRIDDVPDAIEAEHERLRSSGARLDSQLLQRYFLENRVRRFSFGQELTLRSQNRLVVPSYEPAFMRTLGALAPRHRLNHKIYLDLFKRHLPSLARIRSGAHGLPATYPRLVLETGRFGWKRYEQRLASRYMASGGTTDTSRTRSVLFAEKTARQADGFAVEGLFGRDRAVINEPSMQRTVDKIRRYEIRVYVPVLYLGLELTQVFDEI